MTKPLPLLLMLAAIGLVLTACSTSLNPVLDDDSAEPSIGSDPTDIPGQKNPAESEAEEEDGATEPTESDAFSPTPSPLFEQDYRSNEISDRDYSDLEIITLLPPDGIPALTFPEYYSVREANREYDPDELVIGVEFNGDARAYAVSLLSRHEIVNETVGGIHLAVTW